MFDDLITKTSDLLLASRYAVALTGAGISTESGIPDFRGPSGIWTKNPQAEKIAYKKYGQFLSDPAGYWSEALEAESLLGNLEGTAPNAGHYALAEMESLGFIKCVITQNIDNLHIKAGTRNVIEYHGNVFKIRCISCNRRYAKSEIDLERLKNEKSLPPLCRYCNGILKSDIVHFEEPIPEDVIRQSLQHVMRCDLMLICGTSALVYPFAELPTIARFGSRYFDSELSAAEYSYHPKPSVKIVEINKEPTTLTLQGISDYIIIGKTGEVLPKILEQIKTRRHGV